MWKDLGSAQQEGKLAVYFFLQFRFSNSLLYLLRWLFAMEGYLCPEAKLQMPSSTQFQAILEL